MFEKKGQKPGPKCHDTPYLWACRVFYVFWIQYRIIRYCIVQPGGGLVTRRGRGGRAAEPRRSL